MEKVKLGKMAWGSVIAASVAVISCFVLGFTGYHVYGTAAGISGIMLGILSLTLALKVRAIMVNPRRTISVIARKRIGVIR